MKKLTALVLVSLMSIASIAQACPFGTHPVCQYDPSLGRSVCYCV